MSSDAFLNALAQFYTGDETLKLFLAVLALGAVMLPAGPAVRQVIRQTVSFALLCLLANLAAMLMSLSAAAKPAAVVHWLSLLGLGIGIIRLLGLLVFRLVLPRLSLAAPRILEDIVVIVGYLTWALIRLSHAGLDLSSIVTTSAILTAVVAFAMQDTLGNILGGLALQLDNSIRIGHWIKMDDVSGQVVDIRWRYTAIRTRNGETVVIPNSQIMKGKVWLIGDRENQMPHWRRIVHFNVGHAAQPTLVIAAIEETLRHAEIDHVAKNPPASCVLLDFGPGYGHYALRYWLTNPALDDPTDSAVRTHIHAAVKRCGWRLALPEELHHFVKENTAFREKTKNRELVRRMDALRSIPLFADLSEEERKQVAEHLVYSPFVRGDTLTRQGAMSHWLYIITGGQAEVVSETPNLGRQKLAVLGSSDFFGEMGLLTGEPRGATVIALSDMECYRLDKSGLEAILQERPAVAQALSQVLAERLQQNEILMQQGAGKPARPTGTGLSEALFGKIKQFFNL